MGTRVVRGELGARLEWDAHVKELSKWYSRLYWSARERVRTVFLRARAVADMDEELRLHLEMEADKLARS